MRRNNFGFCCCDREDGMQCQSTGLQIKGSDDDLKHPGLLGFQTLCIVRCSKDIKNKTFQKMDLFPSASEGVRNTSSDLG
jgi:hypothetical protein